MRKYIRTTGIVCDRFHIFRMARNSPADCIVALENHYNYVEESRALHSQIIVDESESETEENVIAGRKRNCWTA